ncbi:uncharacterized protein LOC133824457 [Humulus lupulus]|uniref:uncharacterized protein LOC133824457 n=1 Tax=Humulus lupulus TaxID=3486 RepID=UPI002B400A4E|nr:uncharacterized protein LOC133824457 [Humulus lupulus]
METFYNGINYSIHMVLDASANGAILYKSYNEAYEILERIASKNYQWSNARASTSQKVVGVLEVDALTTLTAQVSSTTNLFKNTSLGGMVQPAAMGQLVYVSCVYCGDGNTFESCPSNPTLLNEEKSKSKNEPTSIQSSVEKEKRVGSLNMSNTYPEANIVAIPLQNASDKPMSKPPPPFPQRFQKQQQDSPFRRFLDVLKQLHINIPLVEALEQMPNYVLNNILTKKRRLGKFETVALTEGCSAILKNKIPPKLKDPSSFTIPISTGGREKLGIGEARPTTLTLQLADRSIVHPEGKIEDVLVQVYKFIFLADFIILDYEEDRDVPIILGRPFLATGRTLIDVEKGELTIRAQDE